jgi:hypothetical protein
MPFEILDQGGYLQLRLFGVLVADDVREVTAQMQVMETAPGGAKNRITDLTGIDQVAFGFPEVLVIAKRRTDIELPSDVKSAIIARRPVHVGFARMFQTLNENPRIDVRIVERLEDALRWFEGD